MFQVFYRYPLRNQYFESSPDEDVRILYIEIGAFARCQAESGKGNKKIKVFVCQYQGIF